MVKEDAIWDVNTGQSAKLEVLFQDEVRLDINVSLVYIKSGEEEIKQYVDEVAKPELDVCVENKKDVIAEAADDGVDVINKAAENSERILNSYVEEVGKPEITSYAETTVKPELQSFADGLEEAFDNNAAEKTAAVNALAEQAEASASSAASSSSAAQTAASAAAENAAAASSSAESGRLSVPVTVRRRLNCRITGVTFCADIFPALPRQSAPDKPKGCRISAGGLILENRLAGCPHQAEPSLIKTLVKIGQGHLPGR